MRTARTKVYLFNELSKDAQQKAIDTYRNEGIETSHYWEEAHETVKRFNEIFGTEEGRDSWLDFRTGHIDDAILELKGLRLHKYLLNNFWKYLYKGKYYNCESKRQIKHPRVESIYYKNREYYGNYYYSAITFDNSCTLTGVCYDMDLLDPIYNFLEKFRDQPSRNETTFEDLIGYCFDSLKKSLESEDEYRYSDEGIREDIEGQDYEYTREGRRFE